jgi:hypothetical protein
MKNFILLILLFVCINVNAQTTEKLAFYQVFTIEVNPSAKDSLYQVQRNGIVTSSTIIGTGGLLFLGSYKEAGTYSILVNKTRTLGYKASILLYQGDFVNASITISKNEIYNSQVNAGTFTKKMLAKIKYDSIAVVNIVRY